MQLANTAGLLTEKEDIRRLAELQAHVGIPYRGGQIARDGDEGEAAAPIR